MTAERRRVLIVVTAVALLISGVVVVRAWASDGTRPAATATPGASATGATSPPVIVPGRPGEPAALRPAQEVRPADLPPYNTMDVAFVRMMIPHHAQALEIAALATDRAGDARVRTLAERIRAGQGPEIRQLQAWLKARHLPEQGDGSVHGTMPGMQTPEAMRRLAAARGAEFDRLFVRMMTDHHRGAVEMATNLLKVGVDGTMQQFANSVAVEQAVEIERMRELIPS